MLRGVLKHELNKIKFIIVYQKNVYIYGSEGVL